jgi:hypothetical protein
MDASDSSSKAGQQQQLPVTSHPISVSLVNVTLWVMLQHVLGLWSACSAHNKKDMGWVVCYSNG